MVRNIGFGCVLVFFLFSTQNKEPQITRTGLRDISFESTFSRVSNHIKKFPIIFSSVDLTSFWSFLSLIWEQKKFFLKDFLVIFLQHFFVQFGYTTTIV